jgi:hypothetical protein
MHSRPNRQSRNYPAFLNVPKWWNLVDTLS